MAFPYICFFATFITVFFCPYLWLLQATWKDSLIDKVVAACAILAAYLLTAATILPAIDEKSIVRKLREWRYYTYILRYISRAAWAAGLLLLLSLSCIPFTESLNSHVRFNQIFSAAWWGMSIFTVSAVYIATRMLFKLLRAR